MTTSVRKGCHRANQMRLIIATVFVAPMMHLTFPVRQLLLVANQGDVKSRSLYHGIAMNWTRNPFRTSYHTDATLNQHHHSEAMMKWTSKQTGSNSTEQNDLISQPSNPNPYNVSLNLQKFSDVDSTTSVEKNISSAEMNTTSVERNTTSLEKNTTSVETNTTSVEWNTTSVQTSAPNVEMNSTSAAKKTTSVEMNTTGVETNTTSVEMNTSGVEMNATSVEINTTSLENKSNHSLGSPSADVHVSADDYIYQNQSWDAAPIVLEDFKLVFFTVPKVACTVWKKLFRRMMGYEDWRTQNMTSMIPYKPGENGLKYLYNYSLEEATYFMTSPEYTRAVFVRNPQERFLSAYLDKAVRDGGNYLVGSCCPINKSCTEDAQSISGFLRLAHSCHDEHWIPQSRRVDAKYWPYMNFIGYMEDIGRDSRRLLEHLGVWEKYGQSGWGRYGNESIFTSSHGVNHTTGAAQHIKKFIASPELEQQINEYYEEDYASPWLKFKKA